MLDTDHLVANHRDRLVALAKSAISVLPYVGGLLAEVIGHTIPNQRLDRVAAYVNQLAVRLDRVERSSLEIALGRPDNVLLIEMGALTAADAGSTEKVERISELVARGIEPEEARAVHQLRLLKIFAEIDDEQYLMLVEEAKFHIKDDRKFTKVVRPKFSAYSEGWNGIIDSTLFETGREGLFSLGLLERKVRFDHGTPRPNFSGDGFESREGISRLGLLLLRETGFPDLPRP